MTCWLYNPYILHALHSSSLDAAYRTVKAHFFGFEPLSQLKVFEYVAKHGQIPKNRDCSRLRSQAALVLLVTRTATVDARDRCRSSWPQRSSGTSCCTSSTTGRSPFFAGSVVIRVGRGVDFACLVVKTSACTTCQKPESRDGTERVVKSLETWNSYNSWQYWAIPPLQALMFVQVIGLVSAFDPQCAFDCSRCRFLDSSKSSVIDSIFIPGFLD